MTPVFYMPRYDDEGQVWMSCETCKIDVIPGATSMPLAALRPLTIVLEHHASEHLDATAWLCVAPMPVPKDRHDEVLGEVTK